MTHSLERHALGTTQTSLAKCGELDAEALFRNISADENGEGIRFRKVDPHQRCMPCFWRYFSLSPSTVRRGRDAQFGVLFRRAFESCFR